MHESELWSVCQKGVLRAACIALTVLAGAAFAEKPPEQERDLPKEIDALREEQKAMRAELADIKRLLLPKPAGTPMPDTPLDLRNAYEGGDKNAEVVLVEFSDYECPYCARLVSEVMPEVTRDYIMTGKIRYVFRNFPLERIHPQAAKAAEAAECAGEQGRFWEMHQLLFDRQEALTAADLLKYGDALKLEAKPFKACLDSGKFTKKIREDLADGLKAGVSGTPTLLIGVAKPGERVVTLRRAIVGGAPYPNLKAALDSFLPK